MTISFPSKIEAISNLKKEIGRFFSENKERNSPLSRWIECRDTGAKIYIRKAYYLIGEQHNLRCCFCFANIDIPKKIQKKGIFTSLLDFAIKKSPFKVIYIESVCNKHLVSFLLKRGFKIKEGEDLNPEGTRSYYLDLAN